MPLIYVHGIANRPGRKTDAAEKVRDGLFRKFLMPDGAHRIYSPFWGDMAGRLHWGGASIPRRRGQALGTADEITELAELLADDGARDPDRTVLDTALRSFPDGVDLLFAAALAGDPDLTDDAVAELGDLAARLSGLERPEWLADATDDADLLIRLRAETSGTRPQCGPQALGAAGSAWGLLKRGTNRLRRAAVGAAERPVIGAARLTTRKTVPVLVGDVLAYLAQRGTREAPGPIVAGILDAVDRAAAENEHGLPLTIVAHSMGGNIVYDILSHFRPGLRVNALVTVGSQVGLFEELKLFHASDPAVPGPDLAKVAAPAGISKWINVVDRNDPLAFRAQPVFELAEDYDYPSGAIWAHSAYLREPNFYARLAKRIAG